jgi:hypothetical protein
MTAVKWSRLWTEKLVEEEGRRRGDEIRLRDSFEWMTMMEFTFFGLPSSSSSRRNEVRSV